MSATLSLADAKAAALQRAVELAHRSHLDDPSLGGLVEQYYRHVAPEDVARLDAGDILGAVASQWRLAEDRLPGEAAIRVFTPTVEEQGWSCGHSVLEIVTDDMPFLVDSVMGALTTMDRGIHLVIHPQVAVVRDAGGRLQRIVEDRAADGAILESWMHVEFDREPDAADLEAVEATMRRVLGDVRAAVEDWPAMTDHVRAIADDLELRPPKGVDAAEVAESVAFLRWLADDNITFLGYREYDLRGDEQTSWLEAVPDSGLGILRMAGDAPSTSGSFEALPPESRARAREPRVLVITKANSRATVHRPVHLDYIGVKAFDEDGTVVGERRILGLFTAAAYSESVLQIPVLRRVADAVLASSGFGPRSHSGKDLLQFVETYPRDELFQVTADEILDVAVAVMHLQERRQTRLFMRRDAYGRFMSCLVYLPRDRYTTSVRVALAEILSSAFGAESVDYTARVSESVLARLHFVVRMPSGVAIPDVDESALERSLVDATRNWAEDFSDAILEHVGEADAALIRRAYANALPEGYKEDVAPRAAVADIVRLEALRVAGGEGMALSFYEPYGTDLAMRRFKVYRSGSPIPLAQMLPVLQAMGVAVDDQRPYEIGPVVEPGSQSDVGSTAWIYDFGLRLPVAHAPSEATLRERFEEAFRASWSGETDVDDFNGLVVTAGLDWRQVSILRSYARYLRQVNYAFGQDFIESVIIQHVGISRLLVDMFEARFDPDRHIDRNAAASEIRQRILAELDDVPSLDHDRVLRSFLELVGATLRTNYFQRDADGAPRPALAVKFDPTLLTDLPAPRPRFEIWVHSPRVEGVHLRFGSVARGGLRWSDRREDFRTEVLGLVKAQEVKNAVIVPVGAKGGFYPKRLADPGIDRDAWLAEGTACYQLFVSSLLDMTDNLVNGDVVPPDRVVRHDGDDPYLVVAADKGTASFSDIANEISARYSFWLGDAFASGGSVGYDHKAMGITAKGAWESVKRHFRELGVDTQSQDFTVVGIGDMSGDVFGNGMLLSPHIRLIAAFDHRHVFLDPDPDAERSYAERARLFSLPRSSWADYDASAISAGGGVHSRTAKSIPVTPEVRAVLGLAPGVEAMAPADLIRAVVQAPVDLLWNGGIGTYVKAHTERNADVGDKSNDAIRIDGRDLRCRVVGEGGNLGFTQLGRVEAAMAGVRLNTDAIDNSAGVDASDHEVNIKILLDRIVRDGDLTLKQRNALLADMTDEVGRLVLVDNIEQNVVLGNARAGAGRLVSVHRRVIDDLVARGLLDRELERLPSDEELAARERAGLGLTSPELAVLLAYTKIWLTGELNESDIAADAYFDRVLRGYFPAPLVEQFGERLGGHPLRGQIIATTVCNRLVNRSGISFAYRAIEETGATPADVVRAATASIAVFGLEELWEEIDALDNVISTEVQSALYIESRRLVDRATRWFLQTRGGTIDVAAEVARYREPIEQLAPLVPAALQGGERLRLERHAAGLTEAGVPDDLALRCAALLDVFVLLDVAEIALRTSRPADDVLRLYFAISERYGVDRTLLQITALTRGDRWQVLARQALRSDLYAVLGGLTSRVIRSTSAHARPEEQIAEWEAAHAEGLSRARATLAEVAALDAQDLATLSVVLRTLRNLSAQASTTTAWG